MYIKNSYVYQYLSRYLFIQFVRNCFTVDGHPPPKIQILLSFLQIHKAIFIDTSYAYDK